MSRLPRLDDIVVFHPLAQYQRRAVAINQSGALLLQGPRDDCPTGHRRTRLLTWRCSALPQQKRSGFDQKHRTLHVLRNCTGLPESCRSILRSCKLPSEDLQAPKVSYDIYFFGMNSEAGADVIALRSSFGSFAMRSDTS